MRRLILPFLLGVALTTATACAADPSGTAAPTPLASPSAAVATSAAPSPSAAPDNTRYQGVCDGYKAPRLEVGQLVAVYAGFVQGIYQGGDASMKKVLADLKPAMAAYRAHLAAVLASTTDAKLIEAIKPDIARMDAWTKQLNAAGTDYDGKVNSVLDKGWADLNDNSSLSAFCRGLGL